MTLPPTHLRTWIGLVAAVLLIGAGCSESGSDDGPGAPERDEAVSRIATEVMLPGFERLDEAATSLATGVGRLCAAPDDAALADARSSWGDASAAWSATSAYRLGPQRPRQLSAIDFAIDPEKVEELASADPSAAPPTVEALDALGADVRGLRAVEQLLFAPSSVAELSPRECEYASSASQLVADAASELHADWTEGVGGGPPLVEQVVDPATGSTWSSATDVLEDLLNSCLSALSSVVDMQLGPATGSTNGEPDPGAVDTGAAHSASAEMIEALGSVSAVYGDSEASPPSGFSALVAAAGAGTSDADIRSDLGSAIGSIRTVDLPLADVAPGSSEMASLEEAEQAARAVRSSLSTEVASLLGLTVSFSDSDGDA